MTLDALTLRPASTRLSAAVFARVLAAVLLGVPAAPSAAGEDALRALRWQHRVLLMFAPDAIDPRAAGFERVVDAHACGLEDRDLVIARLYTAGGSRLGADALDAADAARLRREHAVAPDAFAVVLIGKDGGTKLRTDVVPDADKLFGLIDAMPMRIDEMRARDADCPPRGHGARG